jgi:D-alanyl-lipoteichoic acid acyltransferase DltB (MBOAT superfamily)
LGGSRGSKWKVVRNTFIIFLVSGFWHGANWTFIAWGAFHAILFLPLILLGKNRKNTDTVAEGRILPSVKELFQMLLTFGLVVIGWVLFRAETIGDAVQYLAGIPKKSIIYAPLILLKMKEFWFILAMVVVEWIGRNEQYGIQKIGLKWKPVFRYAFYYLLIISIWFFGGKEHTFIYFQF